MDSTDPDSGGARRPLSSRETNWARTISALLARRGVSPDFISATSLVFASLGAAALLSLPAPAGPLLCAIGAQGRLLCNLFDGMVAIEGGRAGPLGPLWNELPDRVADTILLVALGMAAGQPELGWAAALLAMLTAYVRMTGGALGLQQNFAGIMAKPQRMAVLTVACMVAAVAPWFPRAAIALPVATYLIVAGSAWTAIGRTWQIASALRARSVAGKNTTP